MSPRALRGCLCPSHSQESGSLRCSGVWIPDPTTPLLTPSRRVSLAVPRPRPAFFLDRCCRGPRLGPLLLRPRRACPCLAVSSRTVGPACSRGAGTHGWGPEFLLLLLLALALGASAQHTGSAPPGAQQGLVPRSAGLCPCAPHSASQSSVALLSLSVTPEWSPLCPVGVVQGGPCLECGVGGGGQQDWVQISDLEHRCWSGCNSWHLACHPCWALGVTQDHQYLVAETYREPQLPRASPVRSVDAPLPCHQSCHEGHCPFMLTECPACKGLVRLGQKEQHSEQECPERSLSCRHCRAPCCWADLKVRAWAGPGGGRDHGCQARDAAPAPQPFTCSHVGTGFLGNRAHGDGCVLESSHTERQGQAASASPGWSSLPCLAFSPTSSSGCCGGLAGLFQGCVGHRVYSSAVTAYRQLTSTTFLAVGQHLQR